MLSFSTTQGIAVTITLQHHYKLTYKTINESLRRVIDAFCSVLTVKKLGIYGKSLGGYAAVRSAHKAEFVILDRSFYNISIFIRLDSKKTFQ